MYAASLSLRTFNESGLQRMPTEADDRIGWVKRGASAASSMRLLFLTNFYPPLDRGGWEQWCQEVASALCLRGHEVSVLTSDYLAKTIRGAEANIDRSLSLESDLVNYDPLSFFLSWRRNDRSNRRRLKRAILDARPDAVVIWGMWQLNPQLALLAEDLMPDRVAHYLCGYWPIEQSVHAQYWTTPANRRWARPAKKALSRLAMRLASHKTAGPRGLNHAAAVSRAVIDIVRAGGVELPNARVIYGGIQLERFHRQRTELQIGRPLRLLYAGSVSQAKGVHIAFEAIAGLDSRLGASDLHLTVVGSGHPQFESDLRRFVKDKALESCITFCDRISNARMHEILGDYDVLLFPSIWQEPLARMMMEAMAAGLVVVSTTTGGSREVLEHGVNALTFAAGDAKDLGRQIESLLAQPGLMHRLALGAQKTARERFDFKRMVDEIEAFVREVAGRN